MFETPYVTQTVAAPACHDVSPSSRPRSLSLPGVAGFSPDTPPRGPGLPLLQTALLQDFSCCSIVTQAPESTLTRLARSAKQAAQTVLSSLTSPKSEDRRRRGSHGGESSLPGGGSGPGPRRRGRLTMSRAGTTDSEFLEDDELWLRKGTFFAVRASSKKDPFWLCYANEDLKANAVTGDIFWLEKDGQDEKGTTYRYHMRDSVDLYSFICTVPMHKLSRMRYRLENEDHAAVLELLRVEVEEAKRAGEFEETGNVDMHEAVNVAHAKGALASAEAAKAKRRRGRPSKATGKSNTGVTGASVGSVSGKRRGRPPKGSSEPPAAASGKLRGRGRPPKASSASAAVVHSESSERGRKRSRVSTSEAPQQPELDEMESETDSPVHVHVNAAAGGVGSGSRASPRKPVKGSVEPPATPVLSPARGKRSRRSASSAPATAADGGSPGVYEPVQDASVLDHSAVPASGRTARGGKGEVLFDKEAFVAVLAPEDTDDDFWLCRLFEPVYASSKKVRVVWMDRKKSSGHGHGHGTYELQFEGEIERDTILCDVQLDAVTKKGRATEAAWELGNETYDFVVQTIEASKKQRGNHGNKK